MKLRIYSLPPEGQEKEHYLRLVEAGNAVKVEVVTSTGEWERTLLKFQDNGTLCRYEGLSGLGFKEDRNGRIRLDEDN